MEALDREGGDEGETLARRDDAEAIRLVLSADGLGEEFGVGNPGRGGEAGLGANAGPDLFGYGGGDADAAQILGHVEIRFVQRQRLDMRRVVGEDGADLARHLAVDVETRLDEDEVGTAADRKSTRLNSSN